MDEIIIDGITHMVDGKFLRIKTANAIQIGMEDRNVLFFENKFFQEIPKRLFILFSIISFSISFSIGLIASIFFFLLMIIIVMTIK